MKPILILFWVYLHKIQHGLLHGKNWSQNYIILPLGCYLTPMLSKGHLFIILCGKLPKSLRLLTSMSHSKPFSFCVRMPKGRVTSVWKLRWGRLLIKSCTLNFEEQHKNCFFEKYDLRRWHKQDDINILPIFYISLLRKEPIISHHLNQKRIAFFKFLTPPSAR